MTEANEKLIAEADKQQQLIAALEECVNLKDELQRSNALCEEQVVCNNTELKQFIHSAFSQNLGHSSFVYFQKLLQININPTFKVSNYSTYILLETLLSACFRVKK